MQGHGRGDGGAGAHEGGVEGVGVGVRRGVVGVAAQAARGGQAG
jgi:hypothetical protein